MPSKYQCPLCHSEDITEYEDIIECPNCSRRWHKDFISAKIPKEHNLSSKELNGFLDAFEEIKDKKTCKKLLKSIEKDLREQIS